MVMLFILVLMDVTGLFVTLLVCAWCTLLIPVHVSNEHTVPTLLCLSGSIDGL